MGTKLNLHIQHEGSALMLDDVGLWMTRSNGLH